MVAAVSERELFVISKPFKHIKFRINMQNLNEWTLNEISLVPWGIWEI